MSGLSPSSKEERKEKLLLINDIYQELPSLWVEDEFGLKLDAWQIKMLDRPEMRICSNIRRQVGKSLLSAPVCAHFTRFRPAA